LLLFGLGPSAIHALHASFCRCLHSPITLPCIYLSHSLAFTVHIPLHLPVTFPPNHSIHDALSHCLSSTLTQQQPWVSTAEDDDEGIQQQLRKLEAVEASHAQMSLVQSRLLSLALGTSLAPSCTHTRVSLSFLLSPLSCVLFPPSSFFPPCASLLPHRIPSLSST
jgi:hypothetical protein